MAPALTSNSFRLAPAAGGRLYSKPETKSRTATISAQARQNLFNFGKQPKEDASPEDEAKADGNKPKFFIDFGKFPDAKTLVPVVASPATSLFASPRRKDPRAVFVAGATGQAGARIAWALLRQGFSVRAGVPDLPSAQELARLASAYKIISPEESRRLNAVEALFEDAESIAKAIGPATKVVVTVGAAEKGTSAEVTTNDALEIVRAAKLAGVGHVAVVYNSLSGGFPGQSTYNVLDGITSFFSNLFSQTQPLTLSEFLAKVAELDLSYTLIKAALAEDYAEESSYPLVFSKEGSTEETPSDFKVSKLQIARLVADVFSNTSFAENKVVEVSTSPSATSKSIAELFSAIPQDGRREAYAEAMAKAKEEQEALLAAEKASKAKEASETFEEEDVKKPRAASLGDEFRQRADLAGASLDGLFSKAKGLGNDLSWDKLSSQLAAAVAQNGNSAATASGEKTKTQLATVRGQAKARSLPPKKATVKQQPPPPPPPRALRKSKPNQQAEPKPAEVKKIFGGLFKQETIYVDDD